MPIEEGGGGSLSSLHAPSVAGARGECNPSQVTEARSELNYLKTPDSNVSYFWGIRVIKLPITKYRA